jgi:hypothetical protein
VTSLRRCYGQAFPSASIKHYRTVGQAIPRLHLDVLIHQLKSCYVIQLLRCVIAQSDRWEGQQWIQPCVQKCSNRNAPALRHKTFVFGNPEECSE